MRALFTALALVGLAGTATAKEKPKEEEAANNFVTVTPVALPVIVKNQVVNYIFVRVRIDLKRGSNAQPLRDKEPYFRDALVRAAHRTPFTLADNYLKLDEDKMKATLLEEARVLGSADIVTGVTIMEQTPKSSRVIAPR